MDLGSGELKMVLKDGEKITYDVPNVSLFYRIPRTIGRSTTPETRHR